MNLLPPSHYLHPIRLLYNGSCLLLMQHSACKVTSTSFGKCLGPRSLNLPVRPSEGAQIATDRSLHTEAHFLSSFFLRSVNNFRISCLARSLPC